MKAVMVKYFFIFHDLCSAVCFCVSETLQTIPLAFFTVLNINLHVAI